MLLNAAKCHGYNFYCFWVIKGKPTGDGGGGVKLPFPNPHKLTVEYLCFSFLC